MLIEGMLKRLITVGELTLIDARGRRHVFSGSPGRHVVVRIHDEATERAIALRPDPAVGEAYMDGRLTIEEGNLFDFVMLGMENVQCAGHGQLVRWLEATNQLLRPLHTWNTRRRARRNVAHHYDLSDELYRLFLDEERQYSCAYLPSGREDIERAQRLKELHIASKLLLEPGMRVLDIGSGWGALGIHLARNYDVDVTGVTLSTEQCRWSNERARQLGLDRRVRFLLQDYREVEGEFDRIVSVGMFEHVGLAQYRTMFRKMRDLMKPDGVALLHSIGRSAGPGYTSPFIRKYIFPGGYIPALSEVVPAIEKARLWITDVEILRLHYAETLKLWRQRFYEHWDRAKALYDERFCRMWEFYLVGSEAFFRVQDGMNFQIQFAAERDAVPLTRDYMVDHERSRRGRRADLVHHAAE
jgi:cyclopropane-fatty-acyl-phospholipid synthase